MLRSDAMWIVDVRATGDSRRKSWTSSRDQSIGLLFCQTDPATGIEARRPVSSATSLPPDSESSLHSRLIAGARLGRRIITVCAGRDNSLEVRDAFR